MKPINYTVYTPPSRARRLSTPTRSARALDKVQKQAALYKQREEAALALENKVKELAPTIEDAIALIPKSPRAHSRAEAHIWSNLKLCLGKSKFRNIGRWHRNCTKSTHGPSCKKSHWITAELPDPAFQELLELWKIHDSLGKKYGKERVSDVTGQLPSPPKEAQSVAASSLKRGRDDNESPISASAAKKRRQMTPAPAVASTSTSSPAVASTSTSSPAVASTSTSSTTPVHTDNTTSDLAQLESSDDDTFPSPYTAFVKTFKRKVKKSPEIIDPQVIDITDGDDSGIEELSPTEYKKAIKRNAEKNSLRKGKGKAE